MFRRRLLWFAILLTLFGGIVAARLAYIQVAQAAMYREISDRLLAPSTEYLAAPRGSVRDRHGAVLLRDEPTFDVCLHYAVLVGREEYLLSLAAQLRRRGEFPPTMPLREIADELRTRIESMWLRLSQLTGLPVSHLSDRATRIRERVERIRAGVVERIPSVRRVVEEDRTHAIVEDVAADLAAAIRIELRDCPWLTVEPGARRVAIDAPEVTHLLGRLGAADLDRIAEDVFRDDELRRLRPGDRCGISGVERLGEDVLRGSRGRIVRDARGDTLDSVAPAAGRNLSLTIGLDAQRFIARVLAEAVRELPSPAGAAAVVVDVQTREVLALVSYPSYPFDAFRGEYQALEQDRVELPLLFRAVSGQYPPGSICKAITLVGALSEGLVTPDTTFECNGFLLPGQPDRFRCWIYNMEPRGTHGPQTAEAAVRNSCNIYFFHVGERLGPGRLCQWLRRMGMGRTQGTGLIEEATAVVPDADWLRRNQDRDFRPADAWNFAIGQGEVTITPLQAANVAATIAAGAWAPVRLAFDDRGVALGEAVPAGHPLSESALATLRRGMWRVVNERGGTGAQARLDVPGWELCGKTGSAQTVPRVLNWLYTLEWPDGRRETVVAASPDEALAAFADPKPTVIGWRAHDRYPQLLEGEKLPAHAWFMGYTQQANTPRGGAPRGRSLAISVLIEFGGGGGRIAAPAAKQIAEYMLTAPAP
ncbi:MAG: hypothetical protein IPM13_14600 [Phycisphaerales bacterium]|nr:hypothetical protein [Phycisphaerales bacterium]